jgi:hypothetical protein
LKLYSSGILYPSAIFMNISLSSDPYKYGVTTSIKGIPKLFVTTKLIKNLNVIASTTMEYVFHNQYQVSAGNFVQQVLLCISQFHFFHYVFVQIPTYIQQAIHLQVFRLQVQILYVLLASSILLELLHSTFFDSLWFNIIITFGNVKCNLK